MAGNKSVIQKTRKGQIRVTIPSAIAAMSGLDRGDVVAWFNQHGDLVLRKQ